MLYICQPCWVFRKLEFTKRLSFLENQPPFFGVGHPQKGDTVALFVDRWDRVGCWSLISCMTRFKQNKFYKSSKINGNYVAVPLNSDKTTSQIDQGLDQLTKGKEEQWTNRRIGTINTCHVEIQNLLITILLDFELNETFYYLKKLKQLQEKD